MPTTAAVLVKINKVIIRIVFNTIKMRYIFGIQNNLSYNLETLTVECQNLHIWADLSSKVDVYEYSKTTLQYATVKLSTIDNV